MGALSDAGLEPRELAAYLARKHAVAPLLIDLRSGADYRLGHVPGSVNIPAGRLLSAEWPEGDLFLVGANTAASQAVAEAIHDQGYTRAIPLLAGGFGAWSAAGLPVEAVLPEPFSPWVVVRQFAGGTVLLALAATTQSLRLLGLGVLLLFAPWIKARARAF